MSIIQKFQLADGNTAVIVNVNHGGCGKFYSRSYLRLVVLDKSNPEYVRINSKNVLEEISFFEYNHFGGRGPRSHYGRSLATLEKYLAELVEEVKAEVEEENLKKSNQKNSNGEILIIPLVNSSNAEMNSSHAL